MKTLKRALALACVLPGLAFAQGVAPGIELPERPPQESDQVTARVPAPSGDVILENQVAVGRTMAITAQTYGPSEKPPAPNDRIQVRKSFAPELQNSMLNAW